MILGMGDEFLQRREQLRVTNQQYFGMEKIVRGSTPCKAHPSDHFVLSVACVHSVGEAMDLFETSGLGFVFGFAGSSQIRCIRNGMQKI